MAKPTLKPHFLKKWLAYFAELEIWVAANGQALDRLSEDPEENRLANWVSRQAVRYRAGTLPEDLAAKLYAIVDRPADANMVRIQKTMEAVRSFVAENGRIPLPGTSPGKNPEETRLGSFLHRSMSSAKIGRPLPSVLDRDELLNLSTMSPIPRPGASKTAAELAAFIEANKRWPRRNGPEESLYKRASLAITRGRAGSHPGAQEHYDAITRMSDGVRGERLQRIQVSFAESLADAERFVEKHGHRPLARSQEGRWILSVRSGGAVPEGYRERVTAVMEAPLRDGYGAPFEIRAAEVEAWITAHGVRPNVTTNLDLARWLANQIQFLRKGRMAPDRQPRIEAILLSCSDDGAVHLGATSNSEFLFDRHSQKAEEWFAEHGGESISQSNPALYLWIYRYSQRLRDGQLSAEQADRMRGILASSTDDVAGFLASPSQRDFVFNRRATETEEWIAVHGKRPLPSTNMVLFSWLRHQRMKLRNGRLAPEHLERVEAIIAGT